MKSFNKMTEMQMNNANGGYIWVLPFAGLILAGVAGMTFTFLDFASNVHTPSNEK